MLFLRDQLADKAVARGVIHPSEAMVDRFRVAMPLAQAAAALAYMVVQLVVVEGWLR
jgi:hypothetical protein